MNMQLQNFFLYCGIALFPLQIINLKFGSQYDLSSIFLLIFIFLFNLKISRLRNYVGITKKLGYSLAIFLVIQLLLFLFNETPLWRLISGLIWFGGLFVIYLSRQDIRIDFKVVYKILIYIIFISSLFILFEFFFANYTRPKAFFSEPSYAGLVFYAMSAGYLGCLVIGNNLTIKSRKLFLYALYFFLIALLTKSMHIFSFIIVISIIFFKFILLRKKIFIKSILNFIFMLSTILLIFFVIGDPQHFKIHINIFDLTNSSRSLLTWLYGMDQAFAAATLNPITGLGLGSTGFIEFQSFYYPLLESLSFNSTNHNKYDSYSGLFRLIIETGVILPIFLIINIVINLFNIDKIILQSSKKYLPYFQILFIRIFSSTMLIGILIKEPTYSRSIVFLTVLLFFTSFVSCKKNYHIPIKNFLKNIS